MGSPQPVAPIHPGTVDWLEEHSNQIVGQPALHSLGLVNDVVVQYQNDRSASRSLMNGVVFLWKSLPTPIGQKWRQRAGQVMLSF